MGTSKSYISLKSPKHTSAKRGLTSYLNGGNVSRSEVASRFASALKSENGDSSSTNGGSSPATVINYGKQVGRILGFIYDARSSGGVRTSVEKLDLSINLNTPKELFDYLIESSDNSGTIDSAVVNKALELTVDNLNIDSFEILDDFDLEAFLKELLANIVCECFTQRNYEHIQRKAMTIEEAQRRLADIRGYIYGDIISNANTSDLKNCALNSTALSKYVEEKCVESLDLLEAHYEGGDK